HSAVGAPWQWFVADGAVPPGVTLSGTDTEQLSLSGKPRFTGTFAFTLGFSDARQTTFASYSMTVAHLDQLEVLAAILGKARVGHAYAAQIETRGATGAVSFALERGGLLPPGLTLLPDGSIAGSPMASGNFAFSIVASDAAGNTAHRQFAIAVAPDRSILVAEMGLQAPLSLVARDVSTTTPGPVIPLAANLGFGADFTFSLDPNRFSFTTGNAGRTGSLFVVDLNQPSPIVEIANGTLATEVNGAALRWAPDGNRFAYATEQSVGSLQFSHFIAPADDPAAAVLPIADGLPCLYAGFWSPDAAFYATGAADGSAIYVSDGSSTRTFPLDNGRRFGSVIGWSPDSALVLVMALEPSTFFFRIFALDISADQPALFPMTPPDAQIFDYALSDDGGGFAAFAVNANNSIFVSDLRSPQLTAMTQVFLAQPTGIRWSPDSRRLAVTGVGPGNGTLGIVERDQLSSPVSIADALTSVLSFKWSADSQSVIATTPNATLAIPVNGGPPDTLVTGAIDFFAGVLPGEPPLFVYSDATGVSSVNVSAPHTKVTLDPVAIPEGLAVAPSRRAVFYSRLAGSTSLVGNVSMVDLGGPSPSAPIDVLDFDAGVTTVVVSDASIVFVP
ncbi:MAG TPA: putative Ig domain-containing protein, partial [Myxococcales bacterium]